MLDELRKRLNGHNLSQVSRDTGVAYMTVYLIATGAHTNPTIKTLDKLWNYLNAND